MAGTGAKRLMDVEDAIAWACSQELPKKRRAGASRLPALRLGRGDGELTGRWLRPPGFPSISPMFAAGFTSSALAGRGGEPNPDALIIEAAILGLPARMRELAAPAALGQGIGLAVDWEGAFAAALGNVVNLVLTFGRLQKRPSFPERMSVRAKLAPNGKPGVWIEKRELWDTLDGQGVERSFEQPVASLKKKDLYPNGAFCRLEYDPDPQMVINDRADYAVWALALREAAASLTGRLATIEPMAPAAALFPWAGEADQAKPPDLFRAGAQGLHGAAEAARMADERARGVRRALMPGAVRKGKRAKPAKGAARG